MSSAPPAPSAKPEPSAETPEQPAPRRAGGFFGLSTAQVAGSALAAATSALAASFLGVAGTIVGAVVGSLVATIASAVYAHSLRRASARLRVVRPTVVMRAASARPSVVHGPRRADAAPQPRSAEELGRLVKSGLAVTSPRTREPRPRPARRSWTRVAAGVAAGVVMGAGLALGGITAVEGVLGHPLSDPGASGTSVGAAVSGGSSRSARLPTPTSTQGPTATPGESSAPPPTTVSPTDTAPAPTQTTPSTPTDSPSEGTAPAVPGPTPPEPRPSDTGTAPAPTGP